MDLELSNKLKVKVRPFKEEDYCSINTLNAAENWNNLVNKQEDTKLAWKNSNIAYVVQLEDEIIGYIRGMTDEFITTYVCELLIKKPYRAIGLGQKLLYYVHSLYPKTRVELLASSTSQSFYKYQEFREFFGFRKTFEEYGKSVNSDHLVKIKGY
ncbi:GNAT family N-acetyltransferase [Bacillus sp. B1-b2]|uniref:GNAT family N-acetyltransferase n=1 Tax=Bacillus sp. B1-b2 TaxID=2653201 RepID=UPI0012622412|nr:GNAT family N-acetyltransferase [Bacillus sp. B1-b2]KAB7671275.1 GNAT family N-acetyltransferase [Bacillus sp. B1-b2]